MRSAIRLDDLPLFAPESDLAKAAGHAGKAITARVYDRDTLEHHRRVRRTIAGTRSGTRDNAE